MVPDEAGDRARPRRSCRGRSGPGRAASPRVQPCVQRGQMDATDVARRGDGIDLAGRLQLDHRLNSTGITMTVMVRVPLTPSDHERGERLGRLLRQARGERSIVAVAGRPGSPRRLSARSRPDASPLPPFSRLRRWPSRWGCRSMPWSGRRAARRGMTPRPDGPALNSELASRTDLQDGALPGRVDHCRSGAVPGAERGQQAEPAADAGSGRRSGAEVRRASGSGTSATARRRRRTAPTWCARPRSSCRA